MLEFRANENSEEARDSLQRLRSCVQYYLTLTTNNQCILTIKNLLFNKGTHFYSFGCVQFPIFNKYNYIFMSHNVSRKTSVVPKIYAPS